jgi:hypothetical protein
MPTSIAPRPRRTDHRVQLVDERDDLAVASLISFSTA